MKMNHVNLEYYRAMDSISDTFGTNAWWEGRELETVAMMKVCLGS